MRDAHERIGESTCINEQAVLFAVCRFFRRTVARQVQNLSFLVLAAALSVFAVLPPRVLYLCTCLLALDVLRTDLALLRHSQHFRMRYAFDDAVGCVTTTVLSCAPLSQHLSQLLVGAAALLLLRN